MDKDSDKGPNIGNTSSNNRNLPLRRNALPPDLNNSNGFNNNDNVTDPPYKPSRRPTGRPNMSLKGGKKNDDYVNNYYARIIAVFLTNIFINLI